MNMFTSWKSTVVGLAGVLLAVFSASQDPSIQAMVLDPKVQIALLLGVLGLVTKDSNVTGGTVGQPSTPEAIQASNVAPSASNPPEPTLK